MPTVIPRRRRSHRQHAPRSRVPLMRLQSSVSGGLSGFEDVGGEEEKTSARMTSAAGSQLPNFHESTLHCAARSTFNRHAGGNGDVRNRRCRTIHASPTQEIFRAGRSNFPGRCPLGIVRGIAQCARRRLYRVRPNIPRCWNTQKGAPVGRTTQGRYGTVKPHEVAPMSEVVLTIIGVVDKTGGVPALRCGR